MVEAAAAARIFYFVFHGLILLVLVIYDNRLRLLLLDLKLGEPLMYCVCLAITTWLFNTCGDRPGIVVQEKSESELAEMRLEADEFLKSESEMETKEKSKEVQLDGEVEAGSGVMDEEAGRGQPQNKEGLDEEDKYETPPLHFCHKCNIVQEYRTRHCKSCDTCIAKFDHHCFWIGSLG